MVVSLTVRSSVSTSSGHTRLVISHVHLRLATLVVLAPYCGHEVHKETEDVEEVDEGYGPFQNRSSVPHVLLLGNSECDGECQFEKDECKLDPKAIS